MIQTETRLTVADNSGAREALCIRVLGGTKRCYASVGDIIVVSIKNAIPMMIILKGWKKPVLWLKSSWHCLFRNLMQRLSGIA